MEKLLAKTGLSSAQTTIAVPVIYSLLFGVVTITPAHAEDLPRLDEAIPRGFVTTDFAPVFDFDTDGCLPSAGISRYGEKNSGEGVCCGCSRTEGCRDPNFLDTSNTLHRYAAITSDDGSTYTGHFYALYFEKDQTSAPWPLCEKEGWMGHRHDWEYAAIWTKDGVVTHVSVSAHGDLTTESYSNVLHDEDGHPKIVYHQECDYVVACHTHAMRFADTGDTVAENPYGRWVTPTITSWYELTGDGISNREMRDKLNTFDYGSGSIPLKDECFLDNLNDYRPASYPVFTTESISASNPNNPVLAFVDGDGRLFREGSDYVLDFGTIPLGTDLVLRAELAVRNDVNEKADTLDGEFRTGGAGRYDLDGFGGFSGLKWGQSRDGLFVETPSEQLGLGVVTGMVELIPTGQIDSGFRVPWDDPISLTLRLQIVRPAVKLNGPLVTGGDVSDFAIAPESSRVVYRADQETDNVGELYSRAIDGSGTPLKLNGPVVSGGSGVCCFQIAPDSSRVVYLADQDTALVRELYSRATDGSGTPLKLNGPVVSWGVWGFQIASDSSRVVYQAVQDTAGVYEVYSRATDGSGTPVKLNGPVVTGGAGVWGFQIAPDSSRVVYLADQETDNVRELYSRAIDGSGTPLKLNGPVVTGGDVWDFQIAPDSSRVVYRAEQDTALVRELYSRATDGSGSPVKLNGPLVTGGEVWSFQIAPDSSRVVYVAEQDTNNVGELYSRATDGSGTLVKLSGPLVPDLVGVTGDYQIAAGSSRVVYRTELYRADPKTYWHELYSRAIDGSGTPVKLNGPVVSGGSGVWDFQIAPDGSRVVYRADQDTALVRELYSRATDGSGTPVKLNGPLVTRGHVADFQITPDSSRVVYRANQDRHEVFELYIGAIDGTGPVIKVSRRLVVGGDVRSDFSLSPDGSLLVYRADQDTNGVDELYALPLRAEWAGGASGSWEDPANWGPSILPDEITETHIQPKSGVQVGGPLAPTELWSLVIGAQDTGVAELRTQPQGTLSVHRDLQVESRGRLVVNGVVDVTDTLKVWGGGELELAGTESRINTGSLVVDPGGTFSFNGGTLAILGDLAVDSPTPFGADGGGAISSGRTLEVAETLTIGADGELTLNGGRVACTAFDNSSGGTFYFNGGTLAFLGDLAVDSATPFGAHGGDAISAGRALEVAQTLTVGPTGTGKLTIADGGRVSAGASAYIAHDYGSTGTVTVDGSGSTWTNSGTLYVGYRGAGALAITGGGSVANSYAYIGTGIGWTGTVTVGGADSTWTNSGNLFVGYRGTGTLNITGGSVSNANGHIGHYSGSQGTVTVDGTGSTWNNSENLYVGGGPDTSGGTGKLYIQNDGSVRVGQTLLIWGPGAVHLEGGILSADTIDHTAGGQFNFTGGTLAARTFEGSLWVGGGCTIAPGNGAGTLQVDGNMSMQNGSTYDWELGDSGADKVVLTGILELSNWTLRLLGDGAPAGPPGDLPIFSYSGLVGGSMGTWTIDTSNVDHWIFAPGGPTLNRHGTQIFLEGVEEVVERQWKNPSDGSYHESTNWVGGICPNSVGAKANFLEKIEADSTVTVDPGVTVGTIRFRSPEAHPEYGYTIEGTKTIKLEASGNAQIIVERGHHTILAPISLLSPGVTIDTADGTVLRIEPADEFSALEGAVTKNGTGSLILGPRLLVAGPLNVDEGLLEAAKDVLTQATPGGPPRVITLGAGATLKASGHVNGLVVDTGGLMNPSTLQAVGPMMVGVLGSPAGYNYAGILNAGANSVFLLDDDKADVGLALIGGGSLSGAKGIQLNPVGVGFGGFITGDGEIHGVVTAGTPGNPAMGFGGTPPGITVYGDVIGLWNQFDNTTVTGMLQAGFSGAHNPLGPGSNAGTAQFLIGGPLDGEVTFNSEKGEYEKTTGDHTQFLVYGVAEGVGAPTVFESLELKLDEDYPDFNWGSLAAGDDIVLIQTAPWQTVQFITLPFPHYETTLVEPGRIAYGTTFESDLQSALDLIRPKLAPGLDLAYVMNPDALMLLTIPEPGTLLLLITAGLALLAYAWRRRR